MPVPMAVAPWLTASRSSSRLEDALLGVVDHRGPGAERLPERHGDGVLLLRASHLDDVPELLRLRAERLLEKVDGAGGVAGRQDDPDLDRRRVGVVRGLRAVHVVVRMQVLVLALAMPEQLEAAIRDHLVGVHVGGGARATLDHVDDELVVQLRRR